MLDGAVLYYINLLEAAREQCDKASEAAGVAGRAQVNVLSIPTVFREFGLEEISI